MPNPTELDVVKPDESPIHREQKIRARTLEKKRAFQQGPEFYAEWQRRDAARRKREDEADRARTEAEAQLKDEAYNARVQRERDELLRKASAGT